MSIFVYLAALLGMANCAGMLYSGFGVWHLILFLISLLMAIFGFIMPGPDKADGRVISALAIILAALPLLREPIRHLHYYLKERSYAKEIAPLAADWKERREKFSEGVAVWEKQYQAPPEFDGAAAAPIQGAEGKTGTSAIPGFPSGTGAESAGGFGRPVALTLPTDPFQKENELCRYWTNARDEWILVSKGPDKANDIKVPPFLRPTDTADARGRWIALNETNFADLIYDPTNGSLGKGDLLWANGTAEATNAFQDSLTGAWARATQAIGSTPPGQNEAQQAGAAARALLERNDDLAALAAGTWSAMKIPPYKAKQSPPDFEGRLVQGQALYNLGDPRMAANALAAFIDLNPNDPRGHYFLAASLYYSGDLEEARREFAAAWQIDEKGPLARPAYDALMAITRNSPPTSIPPPGADVKTKE